MDQLQSYLQKIYDVTTERKRYAESKNGALLAVTSLIFFRLMDSKLVVAPILKPLYFISLVSFAIAIIICVSSFVPRLNIPKMMRKERTKLPEQYGDFNNLLSSIRMAYYLPNEYVKELLVKIGKPDNVITLIDVDYSEHIIVNSKIVLFKFKCFHNAMIFMLLGMVGSIIVKIHYLF